MAEGGKTTTGGSGKIVPRATGGGLFSISTTENFIRNLFIHLSLRQN